ncbi:MAG: membrane protein insertion efficiency factor YidD [Chroococcales cyanobacterium]
MQLTRVDGIARGIALEAIASYKTHLSPRKGFACAHRMLHQDESCSDYIYRMFSSENFMAAVAHSGERFRACANAHQALKGTSKSGFGCIVLPCCIPL